MSRIDNAIAKASLFSPAYREAVDSNNWLDEHGEHVDTLVLENTLLTESVYIDEGCTLTCNVSPLFIIAKKKIENYGLITASLKGTANCEPSNVFDYPFRSSNDVSQNGSWGSHSNVQSISNGGYSGCGGTSGANDYKRHVTGREYLSHGGWPGYGGAGGEALLDVFIPNLMERLRQLDFMGFPIGGWGTNGGAGTKNWSQERTGTMGDPGPGGTPTPPGGCIVLISPLIINEGEISSDGGNGTDGGQGEDMNRDGHGRNAGGGGGAGASGSGGGTIFIITAESVKHGKDSSIHANGGNGGRGGDSGTVGGHARIAGGAGGMGGLSFINEAPTSGTSGASSVRGYAPGSKTAVGSGGGGGGGGAGGIILEVVL